MEPSISTAASRDPFAVLGVSPASTPEQLRARYLELVREFPPDRHPEEFAEIRQAYDSANDPHRLWQQRLIVGTGPDLPEVLDERPPTPRRIPTDLLLAAGGRAG